MVLALRQELVKQDALVRFWKERARAVNGNEDIMSPSTSDASSIESSNPHEQTTAKLHDTNVSPNCRNTCISISDSDSDSEAGIRSSSSSGTPGSFGDCVGNEDEDYILRRMNFRSLDYLGSSCSDLESVANEMSSNQAYLASVVAADSPTVPRYHLTMTTSSSTTGVQDVRAATASFENVCSSLVARSFRSLSDIAEGTEPPSSDDEEPRLQTDTSSDSSLRLDARPNSCDVEVDSDSAVHSESAHSMDPDSSWDGAIIEDQRDFSTTRSTLASQKAPPHGRSRLPVFTQPTTESAKRTIPTPSSRVSTPPKDRKSKLPEASRVSPTKTTVSKPLRRAPPGLASKAQGRPQSIMIAADKALPLRPRANSVSVSQQKKPASSTARRLSWNKILRVHPTPGAGGNVLKDVAGSQPEEGKFVVAQKSIGVKKRAGMVNVKTQRQTGPKRGGKENVVAARKCLSS